LSSKIIKRLKLKISRRYWWTDSTIVLSWISSPSANWNVFVAHKVGEIQDQTYIHEWRHVNSEDNPADVISCGQNPALIRNEKIWWEGPVWLKREESSWPKIVELDKSQIPERRKTINLVSTVNTDLGVIERCFSLQRLLRIIAYCLRFCRLEE